MRIAQTFDLAPDMQVVELTALFHDMAGEPSHLVFPTGTLTLALRWCVHQMSQDDRTADGQPNTARPPHCPRFCSHSSPRPGCPRIKWT